MWCRALCMLLRRCRCVSPRRRNGLDRSIRGLRRYWLAFSLTPEMWYMNVGRLPQRAYFSRGIRHRWEAKEPHPASNLAKSHKNGIYQAFPNNSCTEHLSDGNREPDRCLIVLAIAWHRSRCSYTYEKEWPQYSIERLLIVLLEGEKSWKACRPSGL